MSHGACPDVTSTFSMESWGLSGLGFLIANETLLLLTASVRIPHTAMIAYTDNPHFVAQYFSTNLSWQLVSPANLETTIQPLATRLFSRKRIYQSFANADDLWQHVFFVEHAEDSQFDVLVDLSQQNVKLPAGILCLAGSGRKFHGFRNRPWVSLPGNIHLSALLAPKQKIDHFDVGFVMLAAVSVVQTLDTIRGLTNRAMVKWVNDILIGNAKVCGVLAQTQTQGDLVMAAILGIGLNVESRPRVEPTPFVPEVAALRDFVADPKPCNQSVIFHQLMQSLAQSYRLLVAGGYAELLAFYRRRSMVIGRTVRVLSDSPAGEAEEIARGKVKTIGENLELIFEGSNAVSRGRLVIL